MIIQKIIDSIHDNAAIRDVRICMHATIVESLRVGMCGHTRPDQAYDVIKRQDVVANHGHLREFSARDLARYALSRLPIEASVGIAAINSILDINWTKVRPARTSDVILEECSGKSTAVIGHFTFIDRLKKAAADVKVLELEPGTGELSLNDAPGVIPAADAVVISANTIINHTLDSLLKLSQNASFVALAGPSVIFSPVLFHYGVDVILGSLIEDVETVIRNISEGASLHHLPGLTQIAMFAKDFLGT